MMRCARDPISNPSYVVYSIYVYICSLPLWWNQWMLCTCGSVTENSFSMDLTICFLVLEIYEWRLARKECISFYV